MERLRSVEGSGRVGGHGNFVRRQRVDPGADREIRPARASRISARNEPVRWRRARARNRLDFRISLRGLSVGGGGERWWSTHLRYLRSSPAFTSNVSPVTILE